MDFFDPLFQKKVLGISDDESINIDNVASFNDYFIGVNFPYESHFVKYKNHYINSHFMIEIPKNLFNLKITIQKERMPHHYDRSEYSSTLKLLKPSGMVFKNKYNFLHHSNTSHNEYFFNFNQINSSVDVEFLRNEKFKGSNFIVFSPTSIDKKDSTYYNKNLNWSALDVTKMNKNTIVVYSTALPEKENINFNNLVLKFIFSIPIDDLRLGFVDKPNYFKGE